MIRWALVLIAISIAVSVVSRLGQTTDPCATLTFEELNARHPSLARLWSKHERASDALEIRQNDIQARIEFAVKHNGADTNEALDRSLRLVEHSFDLHAAQAAEYQAACRALYPDLYR
jgi:hypothetical protein